jgi:hypothetical protein
MIPPPSSGLPAWVVVLIVAGILIGAGYAGIRYMSGPASGDSAKEQTASKGTDAKGAQANPFAKYLEITGLRVFEDPKQRLQVQMVIVNHSGAELPNLKVKVMLQTTNAKPGQEPISTFTVNVPSIPSVSSVEVKATAATKLRAYEFPDWQFLKADFEVVSQ